MIKKHHNKWLLIIAGIIVTLIISPVYAASDNWVDRVPAVSRNFDFEENPGIVPRLTIEEYAIGDFQSGEIVRLQLQNAEWGNIDRLRTEVEIREVESVTINQLTSEVLELVLNPTEGRGEKASIRIPLYSKTTQAGLATVTVDPFGGAVSGGTYPFAEVVGSNGDEGVQVSLTTPGNEQLQLQMEDVVNQQRGAYLVLTEQVPNGIPASGLTFRVELQNAEWLPASRSDLNTNRMKEATIIEGASQVKVENVRRVSHQVIEVALTREGFSAEAATIKLPLYLQATAIGDLGVRVSLLQDGRQSVRLNLGEVVQVEEATPEIPEEPSVPIEPTQKEVVFRVGQMGYWVNGVPTTSDVAPYVKDVGGGSGRIMVPVSFAARATGAQQVDWDPVSRRVTVIKGEKTVELTIGDAALRVNGLIAMMDTPAEIQPVGDGTTGRTMIPVAHLAKALDVQYTWDQITLSATFFVEE
ncbi:stalk domain-containing protein [Anoxynatronum sibiricum]|uniref:Stalk domain-containing protein n=1 Tax=Anoxynatronum sibiricum TaxID=210623 RepID=A0ABU9W066_9CLOT